MIRNLMFMGGSGIFLWYNSVQDQHTGNRRLNILSEENREAVAKMIIKTGGIHHDASNKKKLLEYQKMNFREQLTQAAIEQNIMKKKVPEDHPAHNRVGNIVAQLLAANQNIPNPKVHLTEEGLMNAYSLANHVVLSVNGLDILSDSQLAFIIAHEIGHNLLDHHMENMSWMLVETLVALYFFILTPRKIMFMLLWMMFKPFKLGVVFPLKRRGEYEADDIALEMVVKAGGDPQAVMDFWDIVETLKPEIPGLEYVTDHPIHEDRKKRMIQHINRFLF